MMAVAARGIHGGTQPRVVVADPTSRAWQGGGEFWPRARSIYTRVIEGLYVAPSSAIRDVAYNFSAPTFFSLERLGYASRACGADWALVHPQSFGLRHLADTYDLVLAAPMLIRQSHGFVRGMSAEEMKHRELGGARGRVVMLLDEPFKLSGVSGPEAVRQASSGGACSKCALAHFQKDSSEFIRPLRPPYDASLFEPYLRRHRGRRFMLAKRCYWAYELTALMRKLRYRYAERDGWTFSGTMNQHTYLRRLAACRWVLDVEFKPSAGQVIAEAALLGIPTISGYGRANAELLLPPQLLVAGNASPDAVFHHVNSTIHYYDSHPDEYALLSSQLRARAIRLFQPPSAANLYQMAIACCP
jgi:hypothetical protein